MLCAPQDGGGETVTKSNRHAVRQKIYWASSFYCTLVNPSHTMSNTVWDEWLGHPSIDTSYISKAAVGILLHQQGVGTWKNTGKDLVLKKADCLHVVQTLPRDGCYITSWSTLSTLDKRENTNSGLSWSHIGCCSRLKLGGLMSGWGVISSQIRLEYVFKQNVFPLWSDTDFSMHSTDFLCNHKFWSVL